MFFGSNSKICAISVAATIGGFSLPIDSASAQSVQVSVGCYIDGLSRSSECSNNNTSLAGPDAPPGGRVYTLGSINKATTGMGSTNFAEALGKANFGLTGVEVRAVLDSSSPADAWSVSSAAYAQWQDFILIDAPTLDVGDLVRVRLTQIVDIGLAPFADAIDSNRAGAYIKSQFSSAGGFVTSACGETFSGAYPWGGAACDGFANTLLGGTNTFTYEFDMRANQYNMVTFSLLAEAAAQNSHYLPVGSGRTELEAINTAHTYFEVLSPLATLSAKSGHDYALPALGGVPEPASWALMLAGFGMIGFTLRTRSKPIVA